MYLRHTMGDDVATHPLRGSIVMDFFEDARPPYEIGNIWSGETEPSPAVFLADVLRREATASGLFEFEVGVTPPLAVDAMPRTADYSLSGRITSFRADVVADNSLGKAGLWIMTGLFAVDLALASQGTVSHLGLAVGLPVCAVFATVSRDRIAASVAYEACLQKDGQVIWTGHAERTEVGAVFNWMSPGRKQRAAATLLDKAATATARSTLTEISAQLGADVGGKVAGNVN